MYNNFEAYASTGEVNNSFVGLKIKGNKILFYYPWAYDFQKGTKEETIDILNILQTITLSKTMSKESSSMYSEYKDEENFALQSYIWVINDYLQNGLYINREKVYKLNQTGRVNWKRTLQTQPIVSNGNVIYKDIVVETKNKLDNIMVEIHKCCVKKSLLFIGWLFNLDDSIIDYDYINYNKDKNLKKLYLMTIQKELDNTFEDNKKVRLTNLMNVLRGLDSNPNEEFVYGVDTYYTIYEKMIDSIFDNSKNYKDINPSGEWHILNGNQFITHQSSKLRPDTILIDDNSKNMFILDSKFYNYGVTGQVKHLPETRSIQKQITYGDYIKQNLNINFDIKNVYNAFLLPFNKNADIFKTNDNMKYIGYANAKWTNNEEKHHHIHTFLIDLKYVVKTWNSSSHNEDIRILVDNIIEHEKITR